MSWDGSNHAMFGSLHLILADKLLVKSSALRIHWLLFECEKPVYQLAEPLGIIFAVQNNDLSTQAGAQSAKMLF
jgi:hypothetical protein